MNYNFENEFINFGQNNVNEEEKIIFCENINETSEEDDDEGLYILNMLRKEENAKLYWKWTIYIYNLYLYVNNRMIYFLMNNKVFFLLIKQLDNFIEN